jgi:N-acetylglutamate synthase-like GNAT family acetyltransferase
MAIEIRKMQASDLGQVMALLAYWNYAPLAPSRDVPTPERTEIVIENAHVAVDDGRIVGVCSYILHSPTLAEGASFAVDFAYQGFGIGKKLLQASYRERYSRGIRKLCSEADRVETIQWLVRHAGYHIVGSVLKRHAFGSPDVSSWTVLELDLDSVPELRSE